MVFCARNVLQTTIYCVIIIVMKNLNAIFKKFKGVDGALITSEPCTLYLSGYSNDSAFILLTKDCALYFTDSRYTEEATAVCGDQAEVITVNGASVFDTISEYVQKFNIKTLGFEGRYVSYETYLKMQKAFDGVRLTSIDDFMDEARMVKTRDEISLIKKAAGINDKAFLRTLKKVKAGITEKQLSSELEYQMRKLGADGLAFTTIVAFGANTSKPHAHSGDTKLEEGMPVTIDFGCKVKGYCSDITRTFAFGDPGEDFKTVYEAVLEANLKGIEAVRAGIKAGDVDSASREYLRSKGLDKYFTHSTGHGVGVEIHENPYVKAMSDTVLKKNMIITVEPGVYMEGLYGVRVEDLILVENDGCNVISRLDKKLLIL